MYSYGFEARNWSEGLRETELAVDVVCDWCVHEVQVDLRLRQVRLEDLSATFTALRDLRDKLGPLVTMGVRCSAPGSEVSHDPRCAECRGKLVQVLQDQGFVPGQSGVQDADAES